MTQQEMDEIKPGDMLTFFISPGAYGYGSSTSQLRVKFHCFSDTRKRLKCEFVTASGSNVHRWLAPQSLTRAHWTTRP